jgi:hypothetical protein
MSGEETKRDKMPLLVVVSVADVLITLYLPMAERLVVT